MDAGTLPFPAAVDDACAALRWAIEHAASLGADPAAVTVGGDSAGGNLATVAARLLALEGRAPLAQLLLYPTTDAEARHPSRQRFGAGYFLEEDDMRAFFASYLPGGVAGDPRASPALATDLAVLPPALVVTAGFDPLRDEGRAYADALRAAGVDATNLQVDGLVHGFLHLTTVSPGARRAAHDVAKAWENLVSRVAVRGTEAGAARTGRAHRPRGAACVTHTTQAR